MKFLHVLPFFSALATAAPVTARAEDVAIQREGITFEASEVQAAAIFRNELINGNSGSCPQAIFIFARGSMELDNMGSLVGPRVADGLEGALGANNVWVQGVGGPYAANLEGNLYPDGSPPNAIEEMKRLFRMANSKCPNARIVAGGYSQGAALTAAAIRDIDGGIRNKIVGTVLFGYTKNQQNNGQVPNYPGDRLRVFCNSGDRVCEGTLIVAPPHLNYNDVASNAGPQFLAGKIRG